MSMSSTKPHHIGVRLPAELAAAVRRRALEEDRSVSQVIRRALTAHLSVPITDGRIRPGGDAASFEASR